MSTTILKIDDKEIDLTKITIEDLKKYYSKSCYEFSMALYRSNEHHMLKMSKHKDAIEEEMNKRLDKEEVKKIIETISRKFRPRF